ncbi:MAG: lycopene cyclase domain-containing protein [Patescibacteria group bacterium]|nr:lycopene cyclase domain-containing protein [Patescibacteria group bacterium]
MNLDFVYSNFFYIVILLFSITAIALVDWRFKLVFFLDAKASMLAIGLSALLLLCFDVAGIVIGIFTTNQIYVSGWYFVTPNLPIEEFIFLFLLGYVTLMVYQLVSLKLSAQGSKVKVKVKNK